MCCAIALIAFLAVLTHRLGEHARLAQLGLMIALVGAGFDLFCDSVYLLVFPALASGPPPAEILFLTVERATGIASLAIAHGAHSVSLLLLTLALPAHLGLARVTAAPGYAARACG